MNHKNPEYLVFDYQKAGHNYEYIDALCRYSSSSINSKDTVFVTNPDYSVPSDIEGNVPNVSVHGESIQFIQNARSRVGRSCRAFLVLREYVDRFKPAEVIVLNLNVFELILSVLPGKYIRCKISGILFRPFHRLVDDHNGLIKSVSGKCKRMAKYFVLKGVVSNSQTSRIFLLDDKPGTKMLRRKFETNKLQYLPDPIPSVSINGHTPCGDSLWSHEATDSIRLVFPGMVRWSKGIIPLLEAISLIPKRHHKKLCFLVIGKVKKNVKSRVYKKVRNIVKKKPEAKINLVDDFVEDSTLECAIRTADTVLMPYISTSGSSGILGRAASNMTPVLGPRSGLLGYLIRKHDLGRAARLDTPQQIKCQLIKLLSNMPSIDKSSAKEYLRKKTPSNFAAQLIGSEV